MAIDSITAANPFFSTLYDGFGAAGSIKRYRAPTFTADSGEGRYTGQLANGRKIEFTVSNVENGLANVRYVSDGEIKAARIQIDANILRLDNVQLTIGSNGTARFARVDTSTGNVQQATLSR